MEKVICTECSWTVTVPPPAICPHCGEDGEIWQHKDGSKYEEPILKLIG